MSAVNSHANTLRSMTYLRIVEQILIGRWVVYKEVAADGAVTLSNNSKAFKINENGAVDYSEKFNGNWQVKPGKYSVVQNGSRVVLSGSDGSYRLVSRNQYEMQLAYSADGAETNLYLSKVFK